MKSNKIGAVTAALFLAASMIPFSAWAVGLEESGDVSGEKAPAPIVPAGGILKNNLPQGIEQQPTLPDNVNQTEALSAAGPNSDSDKPSVSAPTNDIYKYLLPYMLNKLADLPGARDEAEVKGDHESIHHVYLHDPSSPKLVFLVFGKQEAEAMVDAKSGRIIYAKEDFKSSSPNILDDRKAADFVNSEVGSWIQFWYGKIPSGAIAQAQSHQTSAITPKATQRVNAILPADAKAVNFDDSRPVGNSTVEGSAGSKDVPKEGPLQPSTKVSEPGADARPDVATLAMGHFVDDMVGGIAKGGLSEGWGAPLPPGIIIGGTPSVAVVAALKAALTRVGPLPSGVEFRVENSRMWGDNPQISIFVDGHQVYWEYLYHSESNLARLRRSWKNPRTWFPLFINPSDDLSKRFEAALLLAIEGAPISRLKIQKAAALKKSEKQVLTESVASPLDVMNGESKKISQTKTVPVEISAESFRTLTNMWAGQDLKDLIKSAEEHRTPENVSALAQKLFTLLYDQAYFILGNEGLWEGYVLKMRDLAEEAARAGVPAAMGLAGYIAGNNWAITGEVSSFGGLDGKSSREDITRPAVIQADHQKALMWFEKGAALGDDWSTKNIEQARRAVSNLEKGLPFNAKDGNP
jgi:hypothetical protein